MTPAQLRAFSATVRLGSVKAAAADLAVTEAAVSLHIAHLRRELGDKLFTRTGSGLAFTPGGLRLASRAAQMLGLQDQTVLEVQQAGAGRRLLRVATSSLFAEYAAPGLIEIFAGRADDLDVELSVHDPQRFPLLLLERAVDAAIGPRPATVDASMSCTHFLNYQVIAVVGATHPLAARTGPAGVAELREQTWLLGPSAVGRAGIVPSVLRRLQIPEDRQRIFQSHTAAVDEAKHGTGVALAVTFAVSKDLADGDLRQLGGPQLPARGSWNLLTLGDREAPPAAAELRRFVTTPRATQAMLRGAGVTAGRFRPAIHVTLWS
ncbi:LysR family transcriptional regulator [Streptomyces griseofuscus]|uniref:LysR family transcriptional regulator n=1 Tax=Streptomyces griseofuscus TaxID=146922 RepID=A0A3R8Q6J9_9ACTN|nr:LysR family transcriptional regulator [Streptomyces griseofuscus]RRQ82441.1 LysR family transcriptional regulator [Streptomyces griseofuscus]